MTLARKTKNGEFIDTRDIQNSIVRFEIDNSFILVFHPGSRLASQHFLEQYGPYADGQTKGGLSDSRGLNRVLT